MLLGSARGNTVDAPYCYIQATDLKAKLDEAQETLKSDQQMIQWLNTQVTEAQLGKLNSGPAATRFSFKPITSFTAPSAAPDAATRPPASTSYGASLMFSTLGLVQAKMADESETSPPRCCSTDNLRRHPVGCQGIALSVSRKENLHGVGTSPWHFVMIRPEQLFQNPFSHMQSLVLLRRLYPRTVHRSIHKRSPAAH